MYERAGGHVGDRRRGGHERLRLVFRAGDTEGELPTDRLIGGDDAGCLRGGSSGRHPQW